VAIDLQQLLNDAAKRAAGGKGGAGFDFGKLFTKGGIAEQLIVWGVVNQALAAVLGPEFTFLQRGVNGLMQATPLTPAELADMVVRHIVSNKAAENYAKQSGIAPSDFQRMVQNAGEGLAPGDLAEAVRRGFIEETGTGPDSTSFEQGLAESHTRDKWGPTIRKLAVREPTPADVLDAALTGQLTQEQAQALYVRFGGDLEFYDWLFRTRGSAPTPLELTQMALRGIIPWEGEDPTVASFHQGFLQVPWRDVWEEPYRRLSEYRPPPRTVTAMVRAGSLTDDQGLAILEQSGLSAELAAAYIADAHIQKTQSQRDLTVSEVIQLYKDRLIDKGEAGQLLGLLRYSAESIAFMLDLADFQALQAKVRTAVAKVHSLYVAHKIDAAAAGTTLDGLGVPASGKAEMLQVWNLEREANVQQLSAAEIADAVYYQIIDTPTGVQRLVDLGWDREDALIRIYIRLHGIPPGPPAAQ